MASLNDGPATGTVRATGSATGVAGARAGSTGAVGATATANAAAAMGATSDAGTALSADAASAACTGTATVFASNGACSVGALGATCTLTSTAAMFGMSNAVTACVPGTESQEYPDKTQASTSLPAPKANLTKDLYKTPTHEQCQLTAQIHAFLFHDPPDLTHLNDSENKPDVGIINTPKSSTIQVLHSFGVGTNPIGGS